MNPTRRFLVLLPLLAIVAALTVPTPASAAGARVSGQATDARGDGSAAGDLVSVSADYFRRGKLRLRVAVTNLAAVAERRTTLGAFFAKWEGGKCRTEVAGTALAYESDTGKAARVFVEHHGAIGLTGPASASAKGNTVTITTAADQLAGRGYDCVVAVALTGDTEQAEQLDRVSVRLR